VIFELDPCNGNGKVCLVYKRGKPALAQDAEIWFLDRALYWHFLTDSFTAYYRLLITHLGLPQWQYAFTSYGISPQAKVREKHMPSQTGADHNLWGNASVAESQLPRPIQKTWDGAQEPAFSLSKAHGASVGG